MKNLTSQDVLTALLSAGLEAVYTHQMLVGDDLDVPLYPEALVQVEVAKSLKTSLQFAQVELEASTKILEASLHRGEPTSPFCSNQGEIDIVCWQWNGPQLFVEVKDEINNTDDGLIKDVERLQQLLAIRKDSATQNFPLFGGLLFYSSRKSPPIRGKHLTSQFLPMVAKELDKTIQRIKSRVDLVRFTFVHDVREIPNSAIPDGTPAGYG
ncbi:MAG: hypothetical protein EON58_22170, partial [Alphaproteobacteria bacterium]